MGVPDERFGEVITAVVETRPTTATIERSCSATTCSEQLAAYKAPRHVVVVDSIGRAPNGKVDYKRLKALAAEQRRLAPDKPAGAAWTSLACG